MNAFLGVVELEDELNHILLVREFMDFFGPAVRFPLERAVEFQIDLVPGAELVSRPPSMMRHIEMMELKM